MTPYRGYRGIVRLLARTNAEVLNGMGNNQVRDGSDEKRDAHVGIQIEKSAINARKVMRRNDAVLPDEHRDDGRPTEPIDRLHVRAETDHREKGYCAAVTDCRNLQGARNAEPRRHGIQSLDAVELTILQSINDIETSEPKNYGETEIYRHDQIRQIDRHRRDRQPGTDGRKSERKPEKQM